MEEIFVRYLHFLGILVLTSALVAEQLLIKVKMDLKSFKKLILIDAIYGFGALLTLTAGSLLWLYVGKPAEFYHSNYIFHIKLTVFVVIGLLSAVPTIYFLRNRKQSSDFINLPNYIVTILRVELFLLIILPFLGTLIARGIGNA